MLRLTSLCLDRPRLVVGLAFAVTLLLGLGSARLELRTGGDALRPHGHPVVERDDADRALFRDPRRLLLVAEVDPTRDRDARPSASLVSPAGFRRLRSLHDALRRMDGLEPRGLLSLGGLPRIDRQAGVVAMGRELDSIPDDEAGFDALVARLRERDVTSGLLLAPDGRRALFSLPVGSAVSTADAVATLERFALESSDDGLALLAGGPLVAETTLGAQVLRDLSVLVPAMVLVMATLLALMLRSAAGVLVPMLEVLLVLVWTFGAMGWAGAPIALVTTILPVVLMAMCITDEIHLLERLSSRREDEPRRARIEAALGEVGRPIVLTSLTTSAGFLSFTSASIEPLRQFGVFAAFGILAAMVLTFTAIPAVLLLLPERALRPRGRPAGGRALARFGDIAARRPGTLFAVGAALFLSTLPGVTRLRVSDSWVANFSPDSSVVRAERGINESFWGSYRLDWVFRAPPDSPDYFRSLAGVDLMQRAAQAARGAVHVGGVETYLEPLDEVAGALGDGAPVASLSQGALWDVFTVAEMSEAGAGLERLVTGRGDVARARLYVKSADYTRARELMQALDAEAPPLVAPDTSAAGVAVHQSGDLAVATALVESIVEGQLRSVAWAVGTVALLLVLFTRRLGALRALVPTAAATTALLGLMGAANIELGIATSMFASLAVGVGVDFGIHFLHRFERETASGLTYEQGIRATFQNAGRALYWNAAVLSVGFSVLLASSMKPNHSLGLLLAGAIAGCFAASFALLPWLLRPSAAGPRTGRTAAAAFAFAGLLLQPSSSDARPATAAPQCATALGQDPAARALMQRVERGARSLPRLVRMEIRARYTEGSRVAEALPRPEPKTLWGAVDGDPDTTWILYVFSGPGRMAGTTLLLRDVAASPQGPTQAGPRDGSRGDATWFYLRAFDSFSRLEGAVERSVVPGSSLTYEDARGYIATDRYRFRFDDANGAPAAGTRRVLACPRTPEIAERLGYGALVIDVDPGRSLVLAVDYRGLGGAPLKTYHLSEATVLEGRHLAARVLLDEPGRSLHSDIRYEYWSPRSPLPRALFEPSSPQRTDGPDSAARPGSFLKRLQAVLHANDLGPRIDAEIEAADQRVTEYDRR